MQYLEEYSSRVQQLAYSGWHRVNRREGLLTRGRGGSSGGAEGWSATGDGVKVMSLSHVQLCAIPRTVAHQLLCPWNSPGKNTVVGSHSLLQGGLSDTRVKSGSPPLQADSLRPEPPGNPRR